MEQEAGIACLQAIGFKNAKEAETASSLKDKKAAVNSIANQPYMVNGLHEWFIELWQENTRTECNWWL